MTEKNYNGIVAGIVVGTALICMGQSIPAGGVAVDAIASLTQLAVDIIAAVTS